MLAGIYSRKGAKPAKGIRPVLLCSLIGIACADTAKPKPLDPGLRRDDVTNGQALVYRVGPVGSRHSSMLLAGLNLPGADLNSRRLARKGRIHGCIL
jgi:hypothetical protein